MFNKLLPFTLIASFALPFIAKADESVTAEPKPTTRSLSKEQINFMKLVDAAVYIESFKSEESTPEIKAFLAAVKEELQKIGITIEKSLLFVILHSRKLDTETMRQLEEKYITDDMQVLFKKYSSKASNLEIGLGLLLFIGAIAKAKAQ